MCQHPNHRDVSRRRGEIEKLFEEIIKENFPDLVKEIDIQVQEAQRVPNKLDPNRTTHHY